MLLISGVIALWSQNTQYYFSYFKSVKDYYDISKFGKHYLVLKRICILQLLDAMLYTDMFIKLSLLIVSFKIFQALLDFHLLVLSIVESHALNRERFQTGKGVRQGCILSPCLFKLYAKYIMRNAGLDEAQAGIKIARRNISNLRYADNTTLMAESEEEL